MEKAVEYANDSLKTCLISFLRWFVSKGVAQTLTRGHSGAINDIGVDPKGQFIQSCSPNGAVKVWMLHSGRLVINAKLTDEADACSVTCSLTCGPLPGVSPDGTTAMFFAGGKEQGSGDSNAGIVACWQVGIEEIIGGFTPAEERALKGRLFTVDKRFVQFAPVAAMELLNRERPEAKLLVATEAGFIWMFNLAGVVKNDYAGSVCFSTFNYSSVTTILVHEEKLVVGSEVGRIAVWEMSNEERKKYDTNNPLQSNNDNPNMQKSISSTTSDSSPSGNRRKKQPGFMKSKIRHRFRGDPQTGAIRPNKAQCEYWAHGKRALQGGGINRFAVMTRSRQKPLLFSASGDATVKIWWLGKSDAICTLKGHGASVTELVVNEDLPELYSGSTDSTIIFWNINVDKPELSQLCMIFRGHESVITGMVLVPIPLDKQTADSSKRADTMLITSSRDGSLRQWDLPDPRALAQCEQEHKGASIILNKNAPITRLMRHVEFHQNTGGLADANILFGTSSGDMEYIDMFPTPQVQKQYRSATFIELFSPLADIIVFTYQKVVFVAPLLYAAIYMNIYQGWNNKKVRETVGDELNQATANGVSFATLSKSKLISEEKAFFVEVEILVILASVLVVSMCCRVYSRLRHSAFERMKNKEYMDESASGTNLKTIQQMEAHARVARLRQMQSLVQMLLWGSVKMLTLPLMNHVYPVFDCVTMDDGKRHLEISPRVICWEGRHLHVSAFVIAVLAAYLAYAIPFTFCGCDAELYYNAKDFKDLFRHADIRASTVDIANLTPLGLNWCFNQLAELLVKASLPALTVAFNTSHFLRCASMAAVLALECLVALKFPAYRDRTFDICVTGCKMWVCFIFGCSAWAGWCIENREAAAGAGVVLIVGSVLAVVLVSLRIYYVRWIDPRHNFTNKYEIGGSVAELHLNASSYKGGSPLCQNSKATTATPEEAMGLLEDGRGQTP